MTRDLPVLDIADASGSSFLQWLVHLPPSNDDGDGGGGNEAHRLIPQTRMMTMIKTAESVRARTETLESDCLGLKASSASHWLWESGGRLTSLCPAPSSIKCSVPNYGMCLDGCLTRDSVLTSYGSSYFIDSHCSRHEAFSCTISFESHNPIRRRYYYYHSL